MLQAEKKFIDNLLSATLKLPKELLFLEPKVLIRTLRKRLLMTQKQLAKRTGLSQSHIANIESGKISPTIETLQKIFQGLGCTLTLLLVPEIQPDALLERQALLCAQEKMRYIAGTMTLEDQLPSRQALNEMIKTEQERLLRHESSEIWDASS